VNHWREFEKAGLEHTTVRIKGITVEQLERIIQRRIEWARRDPGALPVVPVTEIAQLIGLYGDDLRGIFNRLYEVFQTLEEVGDVKISI
jgi:hypothetical protein